MTYREFWQRLTAIYPEGEARWVARMVMEIRYGLTHVDLLMGREQQVASDGELRVLLQRLLTGEPVQYVLGEAVFCGHRLTVSPAVLIPRPETEELCQWILESEASTGPSTILDIGTGSGCIAVTLASGMPLSSVAAWDVSYEALLVAGNNARQAGVEVAFSHVDVLHLPDSSAAADEWDVIVSNPPYVCEQEKAAMLPTVLDHEPSLALFVPNDDPLLFYRNIGRYAAEALKPGGRLYFEMNAIYARDTAEMLRTLGFTDVTVRNDQCGKERFIRACRQRNH